MDTLAYIKNKYHLRYKVPMPIVLPIERNAGLTSLFDELNLRVGVEVGTASGEYAYHLLTNIQELTLYCVDAWEPYPRFLQRCDDEVRNIYNGLFDRAKKRLNGMNVTFIRKYSMDAVKDFPDNSLDFVYIDANHGFEFAINDIAEWERKVRPGGIVAGHDYWNYNSKNIINRKKCQVKDAIDAWTKTNNIKPLFITNEQNWVNKGRSWFYVK